MRLLTYNVHGCIGQQHRFDGERIIRNILEVDADFVALQEVYDQRWEERSFLRELRDIGYSTVHYGMTIRRDDGDYGNVVLMKGEPEHTEEIDLSLEGKEPRGAIRMFLQHEGKCIEIVSTHFGLGLAERHQQIHRLLAVLEDRDPTPDCPRILLGDLNEWNPFSNRWHVLSNDFEVGERLRTFPAVLPFFALDRVLVAPKDVAVCRAVPRAKPFRRASDHLPLVAEVDW